MEVRKNKILQGLIFFNLIAVLLFGLSACSTFHKPLSKITSDELIGKGMIAGNISVLDTITKDDIGGALVKSFFGAHISHAVGRKKTDDVFMTDEDSGYFGWVVEPGTYRITNCRLFDAFSEVKLGQLTDIVEVRAGETTYIGHLNYQIGKRYRGKTFKKQFSQGVLNESDLTDRSGALVEVALSVRNERENMRDFLMSVGLGDFPVRTELTTPWQYTPE